MNPNEANQGYARMFDNKYPNPCLVPSHEHYALAGYEQLENIRATSLLITQSVDGAGYPALKFDPTKAGFFIKIDNKAKIMLGDELNAMIYRGQNKAYSLLPSFQRLGSEVGRCIAYIQNEEFKQNFKLTPYFQILSKMSILGVCFEFDLEAIAQHYGFKTNYLDITTDRKVAEFFAYTCYEYGKYRPIADFTNYQPTLYQSIAFNVENSTPNGENSAPLIPVGFQAVLRPQKQKAMAIDLTNLQDDSRLIKIDLPKDAQKAHEIYKHFNEGEDLFPKDEPINIISNEIKISKTLDETLFLRYCRCFRKDKNALKEQLKQSGYELKYKAQPFIEQELMAKMQAETYENIIPWIKENIYYRRVCVKPDCFCIDPFPQDL